MGVFLLPFSTSTPSFMTTLLVPHLILFVPVYLHHLVKVTFSVNRPGAQSERLVYRFMAYCSIALYVKQTFVALLDSDPGARINIHSTLLEYLRLQSGEQHGPVGRSTTALQHVLRSLGDHPAVASVGWDVLLCGLSLIAWAVTRGLDPVKISGNAGLNKIPYELDATRPVPKGGTRSRATKLSSLEGARRRRGKSTSEVDGTYSDTDNSTIAEDEGNPEAGAVSWGLFALGGLGAIASGVFGAEAERL
jgi:hypothetical protein